jgi:glycosyltransferase involved in cell wall biosynthesis
MSDMGDKSKSAKPKVVRIIARLNVGGAARQACMLHERQAPNFETHLIVGALAEGEHDMSYLLSSERNVLRLSRLSREISFTDDLAAFWNILKFLRKERPDVVHTHTAKAGALGRFAAWLAGVPIIVHTYHGHVFAGYFGALKTKAYLIIERLMGRISTQIIAVSESQMQDLCSQYRVAPPCKIRVINNGFDLESFQPKNREAAREKLTLAHDQLAIVWAGRMVPVKDVRLLAQVIRAAAEKHSNIRFLVIGDGEERAGFESEIAGCGNVRLLGWQEDMAHVWSAADLALLTSRNEGTPTVLIEAMAAGLPFVSTLVGGVRDLALGPLRELPQGMGYEAANGFVTARTLEALLYAIERIAKNPQAAVRMGRAGAKFALETFSAQRLTKDMNRLYQTLLAQKDGVSSAVFQSAGGAR